MKKNNSISIFHFIILLLLVVGGTAKVLSQEYIQPILVNGPTDKRINIVFLSEGYTVSQLDQYTNQVNQTLNYMLNTQPFYEYSTYFNAYAIYVASNESGSDHPSRSIYRDTYFNSTYDSRGIQRLITIPPNNYDPNYNNGRGKVYALLQSLMPEYDLVILIVNDGEYGGSGGQIAITSVHSASAEVMVHEVGHSFGHLGDEYEDPYPGFPDVEYPNTTRETTREYIPWNVWILESTPIPTPEISQYSSVVGLFEGAHYYSTGWYRPKLNCKMRSLGAPFCEVCSEQLIKSIYSSVSTIESFSPETTSIVLEDTASVTLGVTLKSPLTHSLSIQWYKNDEPVPGETLATYTVFSTDLGGGYHYISAEIRDETPHVRNDPSNVVRDFALWSIEVRGLPKPYYVIHTAYVDHGFYHPWGPIYVPYGGSQQFTFTTDTCYMVEGLYVDGVHVDSTTSYTFTNVTSDHLIGIIPKIITYTIEATSEGPGIISQDSGIVVNCGDSQSFSILPNEYSHVDSIIVDGVYVPDSNSSYTFQNVISNHTIHVIFAADQYTITVYQSENGTITPGTTIVNHGSDLRFSINPDIGYHVDSLFVDDIFVPDSTTSYTFHNIDTSHALRAKCAINLYTIESTAGNHGSILPQGDIIVEYNSNQTFTFVPDAGYHIDSLYIDNIYVDTVTYSYKFHNIFQDHTIRITFDINRFTINASSGEHGTIVPKGIIPVSYNSDVVFTFQPDTGYSIDSLLIDDVYVDTITSSYTFYGIRQDHSIYITFGINKYQLTTSTVGNGSVIKIPDVPVYEYGTSVQLLAQPAVGYHFKGWSGDITGIENPDTIIMEGNISITANFEINTYIIETSAGANGSIIPIGPVIVQYGSDTTFHFYPNPKYHVDSFLVDNVLIPDSVKTYTFQDINSDHSIRTTFKKNIKPSPPMIDALSSTDTTSNPNDRMLYFCWHPSIDPDIDDTLKYTLFVFSEPDLDTTLSDIYDTCAMMNLTGLLVDNPSLGWTVTVTDGHDSVASIDTSWIFVTNIITSKQDLPAYYYLHQNYPNPFNPVTTINYNLPVESRVVLKIFNIIGQEVTILNDEIESAGYKSVNWNTSGLPSGIYFCSLEATSAADPKSSFRQVRKMILLR